MAKMRARRAPFTDPRDGRLKSRMRQAFRLFGGRPLTTTELVKHCYCWVLRGEKIKSWHRTNVTRVANLLAQEAAVRHQAADWISPVNAARTASSRSASVKPRCSCSRATTRPRKTPRFSTVTRSAAAQTARSCESVKASMQLWSCRRDGCQSAILHHRPPADLKRNRCNLKATRGRSSLGIACL